MKRYSRAWWIDAILWFAMASIPLILLPPWIADYFNPPRYKGDIFDPPKFVLICLIGITLFILIVIDKKVKRDLVFWLVMAWLGQLFFASLFAQNILFALGGTDFKGGRAEGFITFCFYAIFFWYPFMKYSKFLNLIFSTAFSSTISLLSSKSTFCIC